MKKVIVLLSLVILFSQLAFAGGTKENPESVNDGRESVVIVGSVEALSEKIKEAMGDSSSSATDTKSARETTAETPAGVPAEEAVEEAVETPAEAPVVTEEETIVVADDDPVLSVIDVERLIEALERATSTIESASVTAETPVVENKTPEMITLVLDPSLLALNAKNDTEPEYVGELAKLLEELSQKNERLGDLITTLMVPLEDINEKAVEEVKPECPAQTDITATPTAVTEPEEKKKENIVFVLDPAIFEYLKTPKAEESTIEVEKTVEKREEVNESVVQTEPEYISTLKTMVNEVGQKSDELSSLIISLTEPKEKESTHTHASSGVGYSMDDLGHWKVCTICGEKIAEESHAFNKAEKSDNQGHFKVCSVCSYTQKEDHIWDEKYIKNSKTHIRVCTECGYPEESKHEYKWIKSGSKETETCMVCGYENRTRKENHNSFLQVGIGARFNEDLTQIKTNPGMFSTMSSYAFGLTARFNVKAFALQSDFMLTPGATLQGPMFLESSATVAVRGKFGFFELYGGIGGRFKVQIGADPNGNTVSPGLYSKPLEAVKDIFFVKLGLGIDSGIFGVLIDYRLPLGSFFDLTARGPMVLLSGPITISAVVNLF